MYDICRLFFVYYFHTNRHVLHAYPHEFSLILSVKCNYFGSGIFIKYAVVGIFFGLPAGTTGADVHFNRLLLD